MATISTDQRKNPDIHISKNKIKTSKKISEIDPHFGIPSERYVAKHNELEKRRSSLEI